MRNLLIDVWSLLLYLLATQNTDVLVDAFRPPMLSEELGCSPTLTVLRDFFFRRNDDNNNKQRKQKRQHSSTSSPYYFDPFKLATDENFARYREAELKHGRICMLAMLEYITIPLIKQSSNNNIIQDIITITKPAGILSSLKYYTLMDYIKVIIVCGILELSVLIQRDATALPGDYGTGHWGLRDKGLHENDLIVELEHGRLCMLAFVIAIVLEYISDGMSWIEQWTSVANYFEF